MTSDVKSFDVFLSHNSADKSAVEALASRLEDEERLTTFLDKWHLIPGDPWQEELEKALDHSRSCAVFLGPNGIGPWQNEEMRKALDQRVRQKDFRVVPVLLPSATTLEESQMPGFLSRLTWVDFRNPQGVENNDSFRRLVAGILGVPPGRALEDRQSGIVVNHAKNQDELEDFRRRLITASNLIALINLKSDLARFVSKNPSYPEGQMLLELTNKVSSPEFLGLIGTSPTPSFRVLYSLIPRRKRYLRVLKATVESLWETARSVFVTI